MLQTSMPRHLRGRVALLAILLAATAIRPPALPAADILHIATLNCEFLVRKKVHVKYGLPFDPAEWTAAQRAQWEQPGYRDARFAEATQTTATVIRRLAADVIGLCEVGEEADVRQLHQSLADAGFDYPHFAVCNSADTITGQHVALFSKRPLREVQPEIAGRALYDAELDDPDSETDTGVSKGLSAMIDFAGRPTRLYLLHFASERGGHEKDAQRIAQATIVRRHVVADLQQGRAVIVLGDLNDHRGQPALRRLCGRDDIFENLIQTAGPTFHLRRTDESDEQYNRRLGEHWSYEFAGQRQQIDHILISPSLFDACGRRGLSIAFSTVSERLPATDHPATDHRAVTLTLRSNGDPDAPPEP